MSQKSPPFGTTRHFLKEKNQKFQVFFNKKVFCAFWALDIAPTSDVPVLLFQNNAEAEQKFKDIAEAYAVLSDDSRRSRYDRFGDDSDRLSGFDHSGAAAG